MDYLDFEPRNKGNFAYIPSLRIVNWVGIKIEYGVGIDQVKFLNSFTKVL